MKSLFYVCLFVLIFSIDKPVYAQEDTLFNRYIDTIMDRFFSIKGKMPKGFTVLRASDPVNIPFWKNRNEEDEAKGLYDFHYLQSVDGECLLLYPIMPYPYLYKESRSPYHRITTNLTKALGLSSADSSFVFDEHVTTVTGKFVRDTFNADSIHFYNIPLEEAFEERYIYCTEMVITKADRASLYFKWYFTEKGKEKEREYLERLKGNLWFKDEWRLKAETERQE